MIKCEYADERVFLAGRNGWCERKHIYCDGDCSMEKCFVDELKETEPKDICKNSSLFGNFYFGITKEQLERLKNGAVLYCTDEYGMFIKYVGDGNGR